MFDHPHVTALVVVLIAFNLAAVWLAHRGAGRRDDESLDRLDDGRLRCPHCKAVNEPEYRFCRECVEKLQDRAPTVPGKPAGGGSVFR